ncbi:MAG: hypothetical protein MI923_17960, partial [Phycisphaerales bacterium]|nr:hypothetical protein [Phycisphaerales bacterium]
LAGARVVRLDPTADRVVDVFVRQACLRDGLLHQAVVRLGDLRLRRFGGGHDFVHQGVSGSQLRLRAGDVVVDVLGFAIGNDVVGRRLRWRDAVETGELLALFADLHGRGRAGVG